MTHADLDWASDRSHGVVLKPITPHDGPALAAIHADPEVVRWFAPHGQSGVLTPEQFDQHARTKSAHWDTHGFGQWVAWDGNEPVGRGGPQIVIFDGRPELDYSCTIAPGHQRGGLALWMSRWSFRVGRAFGCEQVIGQSRGDNLRSHGLCERLGMRHVGDFERDGHPFWLYRGSTAYPED